MPHNLFLKWLKILSFPGSDIVVTFVHGKWQTCTPTCSFQGLLYAEVFFPISPIWWFLISCMCIFNSVAEVLEKHGLQKPILYVKNSQNSEEEAHQLMVKLCRHTGRRYGHKHALFLLCDCGNVVGDLFYIVYILHIFLYSSKKKFNCLLRNPPVSETVWRGLLQDLLDMRQNVYTCLKAQTCHQVGNHGNTEFVGIWAKVWRGFWSLHSALKLFTGLNTHLCRSLWSPCCVPAVWRTYA